jgi:hypothetical protein
MLKTVAPIARSAVVLMPILLGAAFVHAQSVVGAKAGIVQYVSGDVFLDGKRLQVSSGNYPQMENGQQLSTMRGCAELLLAPEVYVRMGENASLRMEQNRLSEIRVSFDQGSALIEILQKIRGKPIRVRFSSGLIETGNPGLYRLDAGPRDLRVYGGKAFVEDGRKKAKIDEGKMVSWSYNLTPKKFDVEDADPLHKWAAKRSFMLFLANESTRRQTHWAPISLGWLLNSNFHTRFYSELFLARWRKTQIEKDLKAKIERANLQRQAEQEAAMQQQQR